MSDTLFTAAQMVTEPNILRNPFIKKLHQITGELVPSTFSVNVLEHISPVTINFMESNLDNAVNLNPVFGSEVTENLFQPTAENMTATTLVQSLAGYMAEEFLVEFGVVISNTIGKPVVQYLTHQTFIHGMDMTANINRLISKIENIIIPTATKGNSLLMEAMVYVSLIGDSDVDISINMQPKIHFRFPMFADGLFTPVKTTQMKRNAMVEEVSTLIDHIV
jgi:hypothetical protein